MYYEIMQVTTVCRGRLDSPAGALLSRALEERLEHNLERIFRVLGLHYPPNDIYNAYLGIVSSDRDRRASAVEFLDNVLGHNLKKFLFPIIDRVSDTVTIERGRDLFGVDVTDAQAAILLLIRGRDPWLRTCAIYCCAGGADGEVRRAVEDARNDPDPLVRETAELALRSAP
jgi:AAA family ATP:ADP antiporter